MCLECFLNKLSFALDESNSPLLSVRLLNTTLLAHKRRRLATVTTYLDFFPRIVMSRWIDGWFIVFNATFNKFQLYRGDQFYLWWKPEYPEKTTYLRQVTHKLYHIILYRVHLVMNGVRTHKFSCYMHQLHRYLKIKLPYNHDHEEYIYV